MAAGLRTLTNHGVFELSAAGLKDKVDGITITDADYQSGARLIFVPASNGQVRLLQMAVAAS